MRGRAAPWMTSTRCSWGAAPARSRACASASPQQRAWRAGWSVRSLGPPRSTPLPGACGAQACAGPWAWWGMPCAARSTRPSTRWARLAPSGSLTSSRCPRCPRPSLRGLSVPTTTRSCLPATGSRSIGCSSRRLASRALPARTRGTRRGRGCCAPLPPSGSLPVSAPGTRRRPPSRVTPRSCCPSTRASPTRRRTRPGAWASRSPRRWRPPAATMPWPTATCSCAR